MKHDIQKNYSNCMLANKKKYIQDRKTKMIIVDKSNDESGWIRIKIRTGSSILDSNICLLS